MAPGDGFVVGGAGLEAAVEDADEAVYLAARRVAGRPLPARLLQ